MITKLSVKDGSISLHVRSMGKLWTFDLERPTWTVKQSEDLAYNIAAEMEVLESCCTTLELYKQKLTDYLKSKGCKNPDKIKSNDVLFYESLGE